MKFLSTFVKSEKNIPYIEYKDVMKRAVEELLERCGITPLDKSAFYFNIDNNSWLSDEQKNRIIEKEKYTIEIVQETIEKYKSHLWATTNLYSRLIDKDDAVLYNRITDFLSFLMARKLNTGSGRLKRYAIKNYKSELSELGIDVVSKTSPEDIFLYMTCINEENKNYDSFLFDGFFIRGENERIKDYQLKIEKMKDELDNIHLEIGNQREEYSKEREELFIINFNLREKLNQIKKTIKSLEKKAEQEGVETFIVAKNETRILEERIHNQKSMIAELNGVISEKIKSDKTWFTDFAFFRSVFYETSNRIKIIENNIQGVYFIKDTGTGAVKIGLSSSCIKKRIISLKTSNPFILPIGYIKDEDPATLESTIHTRYSDYHIILEWYAINDNHINEIKNDYDFIDF